MANLLHNRYQILKQLGNSSTGSTVLAEDTQSPTRQRCVVKQLNAVAYPPEKVQKLQVKFSQEATKLEAVCAGHSQIPNLYGYFAKQGIFYWVREWIEGYPLKDFTSSLWSEKQVSAFLNSALKALTHLHQQNIPHLNLKPTNIIVREADRHPCLAGIGSKALMAILLQSGYAIASEKAIMARTAGFTAPEQTMGNPILASDIYSLGMTAIHLLTATAPLKIPTDKNNGRLLWQQYAPEVSDRFAGVLTRAIHPNAPIRFANAADMLAVLQQSAATQVAANPAPAQSPQQAAPPEASTPPKPQTSARRRQPDSPTVVAPQTILPQAVTSSPAAPSTAAPSQAIEETVVSPQASPAAPSPQQTAATVVASRSAAPPSHPATPPSPPAYSPNADSGSLFKNPFFKAWIGLLAAGMGIAAFLLFGDNLIPRSSAATIDASSPEILAETIDTLEASVADNPDNEQASMELVDAYLYSGDFDAADAIIDNMLDEDDTNANALYQQGRLQFYRSDYDRAIASLEDSVAQDGRNGDAVNMLGRAYQEIGDYDSAEEQFETALSIRGQKGEANLNLARLKKLQGKTQAALDHVNAAAGAFRGDDKIKIHTQRSALYLDLRERAKAEEEWEAAIALSPRNPEDYVLQSISQFFLGDSEGAIANIEQALAINPNFTEAYAMESLIHLNQGNIEAAVTAIDEAVALDEFSISALKIIADVALSTPEPNLEFALTAMDQALSINPNNPYILNQRCSFMLAVQEVETAIDNCTSSIDVNPNNVEAYNSRGQAYLAQFDFESAEEDFTRIIEINEEIGRAPDAAAYAQRAAARTGLGEGEAAKADLDRAFEINSEE